MTVTLERNGLIRRQARSIDILVTPENLSILSWLGIKPSRSLRGAEPLGRQFAKTPPSSA